MQQSTNFFFLCSAWETETVRMPGVLASIRPKAPPFETHFSSTCQSQTLWLSTVWPELFAAAPPRRPHYVSTSAPHSRRGWWNQGTIHILRKHLYSTKLNLTFKFFTKKLFFFVKTKEFLFQHYILTKFSCCSLTLLVYKEENNCWKNSWKCCCW